MVDWLRDLGPDELLELAAFADWLRHKRDHSVTSQHSHYRPHKGNPPHSRGVSPAHPEGLEPPTS